MEINGGLDGLKSLRWILLGGGPCSEKLLNICIKENLNIVKVYGMSETCSGTVGLKLLNEPQNKLFAGRPFGNTKVWSKDGELHLSGPIIMKGYVGFDDADGVHNSKDLGYVNDDNLVFLDIRRKDLIISGGKNINPIEVEDALTSIPGIIDAAVVGKEDEEWGQKVVAYINIKYKVSDLKLKAILKEKLSYYKIPKEFISISFIPRNELGKILYDELEIL